MWRTSCPRRWPASALTHQAPAVWREQLQRIGESEARVSRLVEQLLVLALAEEADAGVPMEAVALDEIVRETVLRFMARADAAGVDLGVQGLEQPLRVLGNPALIDNALRHGRAPRGQAGAVTVVLASQGQAVSLLVLDNGPGLTPGQQQHLMQRGVRGLHADRLGQGAGLGLAIVAKFAQVMGATFELARAPGGQGLQAQVRFRVWPTDDPKITP